MNACICACACVLNVVVRQSGCACVRTCPSLVSLFVHVLLMSLSVNLHVHVSNCQSTYACVSEKCKCDDMYIVQVCVIGVRMLCVHVYACMHACMRVRVSVHGNMSVYIHVPWSIDCD